MVANVNISKYDLNLTTRNSWFSSFLLAATLNQKNHNKNHKLRNVV